MFKLMLSLVVCVSTAMASDVERFAAGNRVDLNKMGFVDQNGKKCLIEDFKGRIVVVDFWVVWCGPCRQSLPEVHALQHEGALKGGLVVIPCNLDDDLWPRGVLDFIRKNQKALDGFTFYRRQVGRNGIATNLGKDIESYPTTLIIDREGKLAVKWSGYGSGLAASEVNRLMDEHP